MTFISTPTHWSSRCWSMVDDDYASCARTYATLIIYPEGIDPLAVTARLGIEPTSWQRRGEPMRSRGRALARIAPLSGWFLTTRGAVESKDIRRHLDWLLDRIDPVAHVIRALQAEGCRMNVWAYWLAQSGQGGPMLSPAQMRRLADLDLELWFDISGPVDEPDDTP